MSGSSGLRGCLAAALFFTSALPSDAIVVGVKFTGQVDPFFPANPAWGHVIPPGTPVEGRFAFDSESLPTHCAGGDCTPCPDNCDQVGYLQNLFHGFSADFGNVAVRANQFVVDVNNDVEVGGGQQVDFLIFRWSGAGITTPDPPLLVNGVEQTAEVFTIDLSGPTTLFDRPELPETLTPSSFDLPDGFNLLSDIPNPAVFFNVDTLELIPFISSDFDYNARVNGGDALKWQRTHADAASRAAWESEYGLGEPPAAVPRGVAAPEPTTMLLFACGLVGAALRPRVGKFAPVRTGDP
ncbi:PEP-CTERM sorting domain-containing protein [Pirellulales bacterium]|nr:PEP-CTERM sorting domain-containing protein [Pirellulales bacterium]